MSLIWDEREVAHCRPGYMGRPMLGDRLRLWRRKGLLLVGGVIQRRTREAPYIVPVTCMDYYRRSCWYVSGETTQDIIDLLWLKRDVPAHNNDEEGDGA